MDKDKKYYLDLLAVREYVDDIIRYCEQQMRSLQQLISQDEAKNERLRYDYCEYTHKKSYDTGLEISLYDRNIGFVQCADLSAYQNALDSGRITDLGSLTIELNLNYESGKNDGLVKHTHEFKIHFEQNASYLAYDFGNTDEEYRDVYQAIIDKLEAFPAVRTIFSKKVA